MIWLRLPTIERARKTYDLWLLLIGSSFIDDCRLVRCYIYEREHSLDAELMMRMQLTALPRRFLFQYNLARIVIADRRFRR